MISMPKSLTKREVKGLDSRIEKFDFKGSVEDRAFLPDQLIESGLSNFAGAIRNSVNATIFSGSDTIQCYDKSHWLVVLCRS